MRKGIQSHSNLESTERDEKPCDKHNRRTDTLKKGTWRIQLIKIIEVRGLSNKSRCSEIRPWDNQSEAIPKWWRQLATLSANQSLTLSSGQSTNKTNQLRNTRKENNIKRRALGPSWLTFSRSDAPAISPVSRMDKFKPSPINTEKFNARCSYKSFCLWKWSNSYGVLIWI